MPVSCTTTSRRGLLQRWVAVAGAAAVALAAAGCSLDGSNLPSLSTGSILPSLPSLPTGGSAAGEPERIAGNLYRVMATDRKIADTIERENYMLLKAAETTKKVGGTHFVMVRAGDQTSGLPSLATMTQGRQYGAYIRVIEVDPEQGVPVGAIAADEIIQFFGPKFGKTPA